MIIAVAGNAGAGKSTLAIKIALELAARNKDTVLVDTDYNAPQYNVWYPRASMPKNGSLSVLLANEVTEETTLQKMLSVGDNLAVLGYGRDFSISAKPSRPDTIPAFFRTLTDLNVTAVFDTQTGVTSDIVSATAFSGGADVIILAITPDIRGLSWYDANARFAEAVWKRKGTRIIRVFSQVKKNAPASAVEQQIGTVSYYFPYDSAIEAELHKGTMGTNDYRNTARKYAKVMDSLVKEILEPEDEKRFRRRNI